MFVAVPLLVVGHMVSVLMNFSSQVAGPVSCGSKLVMKRIKLMKSDHIILEGMT